MKKIGKTIGVLLGLTALAGGIVVGTVPSVREKARDWTLSVGESVKDTWNDLFDTVPGGSTGGNVDEVPGGDESELPGEDVGEQPGEDDSTLPGEEIDEALVDSQLSLYKDCITSTLRYNPNYSTVMRDFKESANIVDMIFVEYSIVYSPVLQVFFDDGTYEFCTLNLLTKPSDGSTALKFNYYETYWAIRSGHEFTYEELMERASVFGVAEMRLYQIGQPTNFVNLNGNSYYCVTGIRSTSISNFGQRIISYSVLLDSKDNHVITIVSYLDEYTSDNLSILKNELSELWNECMYDDLSAYLKDRNYKGIVLNSDRAIITYCVDVYL